MEFTRLGDQLQTLIKWKPMSERPEKSGIYPVLWKTSSGCKLETVCYSARYNLWNCLDSDKDAKAAIERAGNMEESFCGWFDGDFTECFEAVYRLGGNDEEDAERVF